VPDIAGSAVATPVSAGGAAAFEDGDAMVGGAAAVAAVAEAGAVGDACAPVGLGVR
jgi:hypothetical protein